MPEHLSFFRNRIISRRFFRRNVSYLTDGLKVFRYTHARIVSLQFFREPKGARLDHEDRALSPS